MKQDKHTILSQKENACLTATWIKNNKDREWNDTERQLFKEYLEIKQSKPAPIDSHKKKYYSWLSELKMIARKRGIDIDD